VRHLTNQKQSNEYSSIEITKLMIRKVLTAEEQASLSPAAIITRLKKGNIRFTKNKFTKRDNPAQVSKSTSGEFPQVFILSCIESRVTVTEIFD